LTVEGATTAQAAEPSASDEAAREAYVLRHFRRNFRLMLLDAVSFPFGISFIAVVTILPLFVREITPSTLAVGLVPAISYLGTLLPPLFIANLVERMPIQKWYLFWLAVVERLPLLALAAATPWLGRNNSALLLLMFFLALTIHSGAMGLNMPSYFNLYAKVIPANRRGGMWGLGGAISGVLALGGTWLSGRLLNSYGFPDAYALSFLFAFIALMLGIIGFPFIRELPTNDAPPPIGTISYIRNTPALLRTDTRFGYFVAAQVVYSFSYMAPAFYTVYAIDRFKAGAAEVALFTTVLMATNTVANLLLGILADRRGNKPVLQISMATAIAAALLALVAPSLWWMYPVFALNSVVYAGANMGGYNMPLEFAPRTQVPTYVAVSMTAIAPFRAVVPLIGGVVAGVGYGGVFVISLVAAALGLAILTLKVSDPRHDPLPELAAEAGA